MKALSIIRHAQAERASLSGHDADRALSQHGQNEAQQIAALVEQLDPLVDHLICSPANRTRQTADVLQDRIKTLPEPLVPDSAYLASVETLRLLLQSAPPTAKHVAIVGHNPGVEALVSKLCSLGNNRVNLSMQTGTLAHIQLQIAEWNQLSWGCGELVSFTPPEF